MGFQDLLGSLIEPRSEILPTQPRPVIVVAPVEKRWVPVLASEQPVCVFIGQKLPPRANPIDHIQGQGIY